MLGFARKIGMTRLFIDNKSVPVTVLELTKQYVVQLKTTEKDGYEAVQIGAFRRKKTKNPRLKHVQKHSESEYDFLCLSEFKTKFDIVDKSFGIEAFSVNDTLKVTAKSVGKGFTGAIKRYGFGGQPKSHGHDHVRAVGSIGATGPQRVFKGTRMAGRSGNKNITIRGLKIVALDEESSLIFVSGSIPGANSGFVKISKLK